MDSFKEHIGCLPIFFACQSGGLYGVRNIGIRT